MTAPVPPSHPAPALRDPEPALRDLVTDAIRYWERMRLPYNALLGGLTLSAWVLTPGASLDGVKALSLVFLAVGANLLYCAAYVPDVFVQLSHFRGAWRRKRAWLWAVGTFMASLLAWPTASALFG